MRPAQSLSRLCIWKNRVRADTSRASVGPRALFPAGRTKVVQCLGTAASKTARWVWALKGVFPPGPCHWETRHWLLSGKDERDGETPFSGGPSVPLCSGENMGTETPLPSAECAMTFFRERNGPWFLLKDMSSETNSEFFKRLFVCQI